MFFSQSYYEICYNLCDLFGIISKCDERSVKLMYRVEDILEINKRTVHNKRNNCDFLKIINKRTVRIFGTSE